MDRLLNGTIGARILAQPALGADVGRDRNAEFGNNRPKLEQRAVRAEKTAIRPAHKHANQQERTASQEQCRTAAASEQRHKWIIPADDKRRAGGGKGHARPQINQRNQPQPVLEPTREL